MSVRIDDQFTHLPAGLGQHVRAIALVAVAAIALTACSGSPATPAGGGTGPGGPNAGGATSSGTAGGGAGGGNPEASAVQAVGGPFASILGTVIAGMPDINPCTMVTRTDAQPFFSAALADGTTDHLGKCDYGLVDPSLGDGLEVNVWTGSDFRFGFDNLMGATGSAGVKTLAGVGDQAKWTLLAGYFPQVEAIKGQVGCDVTAAGANGQLSVVTTGKQMFAVIDPAALDGFMAKFGALCNLVFAANPPAQ